MPSGSKKRKAAKKKKEQQAVNNNPHGNDDMKSQDERDSDGTDVGSVGSPASQGDHNHNHQHPFNHREEERKRGPSPVGSHVTEEKSVEETARDAKSTGKSGLDEVGGAAHVRIQHVEHDKSSSCSGSSDDESRASGKKSKEEAYNLGSEETSYGNKDKLATVMSMKVAENGTHGDVNGNSAVEAELLPPSNGISGVELEGNEGKVSTSSSMPPAETSNVAEKNRDAEPHDYSKMQPLVASTPLMVQRTSLFSCCGLVDVLTGSNR
ncbi:hypothetical protein like AT2G34310 [Hibiscus trionum]|uniref:Uncharacterized protein n=1 Tax=Hibiscus trionum TaxID=183268 RepID=A0A9W7LWL3_HIBTR|nr:hypothetical protein like AT2G34310 [Hibiscus trionum]